jgi:NADH:ubiquinone oxidoreductase subunit E
MNPSRRVSMDVSEINAIINKVAVRDGSLINALEEIQERYRYLPPEALILASERLGRPPFPGLFRSYLL